MTLVWKQAPYPYTPGHVVADTPVGEVFAGPRASDGGWEFSGPDGDWAGPPGGNYPVWGKDECLAAAEEWVGEQMAASGKQE